MSVIETIVHDLQGMPACKLVEAAREAHRTSKATRQERATVLHETHGCLNDHDGSAFNEALNTSRRVEPRG